MKPDDKLLDIAHFLEKISGYNYASVGVIYFKKAIDRRILHTNTQCISKYYEVLQASKQEQQFLIDAITVPETWFFRDNKTFDYLTTWAKENVKKLHNIRVLSMPCATGEEVYSIAISLLKGGFSLNQFEITGVDITESYLKKARQAVYTSYSFRNGNQPDYMYFEKSDWGYRVHDTLKKNTHFIHQNSLSYIKNAHNQQYDLIFCRNLMIYFSSETKKVLMTHVKRVLKDNGVLFVGHAETAIPSIVGFKKIKKDNVYAFLKTLETEKSKPKSKPNNYISSTKPFISTAHPNKRRTTPNTFIKPIPKKQHLSFEEAESLANRGFYEKALECCFNILEEQPSNDNVYNLIGEIYMAMGKDDFAMKEFQNCIYLNPTNKQALISLILIYESTNNNAKAVPLKNRLNRLEKITN